MKPEYRIVLDGQDLTGKFRPRLINLSLQECRSGEADQLDIVLDDADGRLAIPSKGVQIALMIGWHGKQLVDKGTFTVDEAEHSGTPDVITIRARAADLIDTFRQIRDRSFHGTTVGAVLSIIAAEQGLRASVEASLRDRPISHIDQTNESDAAFLRRLGKHYDAVATIKNDTLIFSPAHLSKTASGRDLPVITVRRRDGDRHRYHSAERDAYSGVRAYWYDQKKAVKRSVLAGLAGNSKRLRTTYATEVDALAAAWSEWQRLQRGIFTFDLELAIGVPEMMPQSPMRAIGWKKDIDETDWIAVKLVHSISKDGGFTTVLEAETKTEPASDAPLEQLDPDPGITGVQASWVNKATKKRGDYVAGKSTKLKNLTHVYATKNAAKRAAQREWAEIVERRELIAEAAE